MDKNCPYIAHRKTKSKTIFVNCRNCAKGNSAFSDPVCRSNILRILQLEHGTSQVVLNHAFVKVFGNKEMETLRQLVKFIDSIETYEGIRSPAKETGMQEMLAVT